MSKWTGFLKKYFTWVGLFSNIAVVVGIGFLITKVYLLELSLPLFSEKVRANLAVNQPKLLSVLSPALNIMSSLKEDNYYFREVNLSQWSGIGAKYSENQPPISSVNVINVSDTHELLIGLKNAKAGQTIVLSPGEYKIDQRSVSIKNAGTKEQPIRVLAQKLGSVIIFLRGEGFVINQAYWQFSNLHLIGNCKKHSQCEHAFHVVGKGRHTLIKNNIMQDFNAMVKINGIGSDYPDYGNIVQNTIFNTSPRQTANPVTPIDLMHANYWQVSRNFIFDIQKSVGDKVSYAAFFKGGSVHGIFERNLIICAANLPDNYTSIGLSLGGGGSRQGDRRNKSKFEHNNGIIRHNIIMHCSNDVGIYLNRASQSKIHHNTLYNTLGIDVRFKESSATILANVISGRIKERENGSFVGKDNLIVKRNVFTGADNLNDYFLAPEIGDFSWLNAESIFKYMNSTPPSIEDFCGNRGQHGYVGAFLGASFCVEEVNLSATDRDNSL